MTVCAFATSAGSCTTAAQSLLRLIPRRTDEPCSIEIRRALVWPDVELVTSVAVCGLHREPVRKASQVVLAETVLGDAVVQRKVED